MLGFYTVEQFFSTLSSVEFAKMRNSCGFFSRDSALEFRSVEKKFYISTVERVAKTMGVAKIIAV